MKRIIVLLSITLSSFGYSGTGGGHSHGHGHGHDHGHTHGVKINAKTAEIIARKKILTLTKSQKVDISWNQAKLSSAVIKKFLGQKEWLVTFSNELGKKGKTLYVFLKPNGKVIAANFTGK